MLTKRELTIWEDSPFEVLLTTVIDDLYVSELLDKHIIKNIHGALVPAYSILSQVLSSIPSSSYKKPLIIATVSRFSIEMAKEN